MADNDIAALITEIEALRAELRAAIGSGNAGQGAVGSNQTSTYSPAANALAMHQMTAQGYVSGLTGGSATSGLIQKLGIQYGPTYKGIRQEALGQVNEYGYLTTSYRSAGANPANTKNYTYPMPSWYRNASPELKTSADIVAQARSYGMASFNDPKLTSYINRTEARETVNMIRHERNAEQFALTKQQGKTFVGKLWKRTTGRYGKSAGVIGGIMGAAEALQAWDMGDDRDDRRFLTNAEERAGMTHADRFGAHKNWLGELEGSANKILGSALTWTAMSTYTDRMRTDAAMQVGKSAFRQAERSATGFHRPSNILKASGFAVKGVNYIGAGLVRSALNPATVALSAWKLADTYWSEDSDLNTWDKKNKESNKKLKSQLDEMNSYDSFTAQQKIDAALNERSARSGVVGTALRGGFSLFGIVDSPAVREEKIRAKLSEDFAQATKIAEESAKEARLGNIAKAEKSIKKARKMAGDLVPVDWQDPMRIYTMQETASRSKACFSRYLNNRVTNRAGD